MERAIQEAQEETDGQGKVKGQVGSDSDLENGGEEKDVGILWDEQGPEEEEEKKDVETPPPKTQKDNIQ